MPPWLRSAINGLVSTRLMRRMKTEGVLDEAIVLESYPHRLVGIHTEDSFIYIDIGGIASTGQPGAYAADAEAYALMAAPVDITEAASLDIPMVVDDADDIDYGDQPSPLITADAVSALSPPISSLGAKPSSTLSPMAKIASAFGAVSLGPELSEFEEFELPPRAFPGPSSRARGPHGLTPVMTNLDLQEGHLAASMVHQSFLISPFALRVGLRGNLDLSLAKCEKLRGNLSFPLKRNFLLRLNFILLVNSLLKNFLLSNVLLLNFPQKNCKRLRGNLNLLLAMLTFLLYHDVILLRRTSWHWPLRRPSQMQTPR